jgi:phosphate transport system protein
VPSELREGFHRELDRQEIAIGGILDVVPEAIRRATSALLTGDRSVVDDMARWRALVGELNADVERGAERMIAIQAPVAGDLRLLMAATRLVPLLADTMDLVADIASPALADIGPALPGRIKGITAELGDSCAETWASVEELWRERDPVHVQAVRDRDDVLTDVRSTLTAELASGAVDLGVAMQMAMTGRSYERLGRHASAAGRLFEPLTHPPRGRSAGSEQPGG